MLDAPPTIPNSPPLRAVPVVFYTLVALVGLLVLTGVATASALMLSKSGRLGPSATAALVVWAALAVLVLPVLRRGVARAALRERVRRLWMIPLALGIVMVANVQIVVLFGLEVARAGQAKLAADAGDLSFQVLYVLGIAVATPVVEELFFRGWLWQRLASVWSPAAVGLATGIAFVLAHGANATSVVPLTVALTLLRLQDGGVRSAIALHMAMNTLLVGLAFFGRP